VADELLQMLAAEADRRVPPFREGLERIAGAPEPDRDAVEALRVEIHGLKGAALVIGQDHLGALARRAEDAIAARLGAGTIGEDLAQKLGDAADAFGEGARAAAAGEPPPPSVAAARAALPDE
jgi:chemotaxis protein histidine kinase CheA